MGKETFHYETVIDAQLDEVWGFFSTADNLVKITRLPKITLLSNPETIQGNTIKMKIGVAGVSVMWEALIEEVKAPHFFIDKAIKPPFPFTAWKHIHAFEQSGERVLMKDTVEYEATIPTFIVNKLLTKMFRDRGKAVKQLTRAM
ncbi:SRPBCC family protein [Halalkalibacterium ligniniphilum]|uniref:SRPBCC family protein n=1 Tax=Halalkalibacterium ligniniphilum TaxID=1134413 RepID=UPI000344D59B|nr:hypothetical protein [Halalkalibacterium ligniniphilum]